MVQDDSKTTSNIKTYITYGILFELMMVCVRPYAIKFLTRIGGTAFDVSLFNAMKGIFMIFAVLPGVYFVNKSRHKQKLTAILVGLIALGTLSFIGVQFFPDISKPIVFIMLSSIATIPLAVYTPSFQSFTGELFPLRRASVIARRNMYTVVIMTIFTLLAGIVFRTFAHTNDEFIMLYYIIFFLSFIFGILGVVVFTRLDYKDEHIDKPSEFLKTLKALPSNKPYLRFITASTVFHFGWQMGWPLFSLYSIQHLGADELWLAIITVSSSVVMFFGHRYWPKAIEKFGLERISTISTFGMAITPLIYAASSTLPMLAVMASLTGLFTSGTITVLFADMLEVTPSQNRVVYVGVYNTITNITLAISPFIGHYFFKHFGIHNALYLTAMFRLFGSIAFFIRERTEKRARLL